MKDTSSSKISETILQFGEPLIAELDESCARHEFDQCLRVVISVWNAVTLDKVEGTDRWTTSLHEHAGSGPPELNGLLQELVERKKTLFGDDVRGVGEHWIRGENGDFVFGCDARDVAGKYGNAR